MLQLSTSICRGFRKHFEDLFFREPDLQETSFQEYMADLSRLELHEADRCEGPITGGEIVTALRTVATYKALGLDGLPYEIFLKMPHMIFHLLAIVFNNWFNQGKHPSKDNQGC